MQENSNHLGQFIGAPLQDWTPPGPPTRKTMKGRYCHLEPLNPALHATPLYEAYSRDVEGRMWTYLPYGPFDTLASYRERMEQMSCGEDPLFFAIIDPKIDRPVGVASYLRITPMSGSIEVGGLAFSPLLQRTPAATESMYLMMENAFALGYRRYEWKCDALNRPSISAAQRLGFTFEGIFRQATVVKGRNRDTAWFSVIDREWPALRDAFENWLQPDNFDEKGKQRTRLSTLTSRNGNQSEP